MSTRTTQRILAMVLAALLALALCASAVADQITVYVAKDGAKVYDESGSVVGTLALNTALTLTGVHGKVCRVEKDGRTAYMNKADLSQSPVASGTPEAEAPKEPETKSVTAYVRVEGAKVCDAGGNVIATLSLNTSVTVTAVKGSVCQVVVNGSTGYMRKGDLSASPVASETPEAEDPKEPEAKSVTAYACVEGAKVCDASGNVIATLSLNTSVTVTAVKGNVCQVVVNGSTGYMRRSELSCEKTDTVAPTSVSGGSTVSPAKGTAVEMDWWTSDIQTIFARGVVAQITDVETGLSWRERRNGGTNHADCQPLTAADTAAMKKAYGGKWSWDRRAVFVTINGVNYAASINGMPHGSGSIKDNDFNGHHCIHFTNSRTHGTNKVCPKHQAAIKKAASTTL